MSLQNAIAGNSFGRISVAFGTVINRLVPGAIGLLTRLVALIYTCAGTAHTLTFCRPIGRAAFTASSDAAATTITLDRNPGPTGDKTRGNATNRGYPQGVTANPLAANDLVAIREIDGVTRLYTVSAVDATGLVFTIGALTAGVAADGFCALWMYGLITDTDPSTGLAHATKLTVVSVVNKYPENPFQPIEGILATFRADEPILIQSDNATATGAIDGVEFAYIKDFT